MAKLRRKRGRGEEAEEEERTLVGVVQYVVGFQGSDLKEGGKRMKGMVEAHFLELIYMMLPPWDPERTRT